MSVELKIEGGGGFAYTASPKSQAPNPKSQSAPNHWDLNQISRLEICFRSQVPRLSGHKADANTISSVLGSAQPNTKYQISSFGKCHFPTAVGTWYFGRCQARPSSQDQISDFKSQRWYLNRLMAKAEVVGLQPPRPLG